MRVLVVEDDCSLGGFLVKGLRLDGHEVEWVEDGQAALDRMADRRPALLVLDLSLPKKDGTEVLEALVGRFDGMAVLVLTGRCDLEVRIQCLNLGADDCMLKPFNLSELRARCRALLRRREQYADPVLRVGGLELNRIERKVTRDGQIVDLTTKEFALLEFLLQHRGLCCSRSELLREVWQMKADTGTNVVDVYINYLRRKLAAAYATAHLGSAEPGESVAEIAIGELGSELIETVRGEGYRLSDSSASFARVGDATRKPVRSVRPVSAQESIVAGGSGWRA
ncbi:DNA-binding response OmpR family regulator [Granulicella aggregans]|uniref:DNA-binding response OmpR family regulator n=1 Tax=Granulicella aggregans TaxID=474949 RepID=A0A7W7ZCW4_9BACT|nr:response regulator transcription factor [Granulicella aggregans]MBB5057610.1 DNA-binding response OmpR family regulator [Granulicella aggregans]